MDHDIAERFDRVENALVRLAEAQLRTDANVRELATAQLRTETRVAELAEGLTTLSQRVDRLAQLMIRGHTDAADRHAVIIERLDKLETK